MLIFVAKESASGERRIPLTVADAARLVKLGAQLEIEAGLGQSIHESDEDFEAAGATVSTSRRESLARADVVLRLRKPPLDEVGVMKRGGVHISYLDPFNEKELVRALAAAGVSAISMEMIPRTTLAQKMDALSSQANLAGYVSVILAAERLNRILPLMMTPAGTLAAAHVFVIGAGVAGLQAIATAKRLGARVEAFDTRPVVEEQVQSLGARFVKFDLGETGQTKDGYATALTEEQLKRQREEMARHCAKADVVITTAQVFGRKAPVIVTTDMVKAMKPGSVVVDAAIDGGGNVECSRLDEEVMVNRVRVVGLGNLPGRVPVHASQMYSSNLCHLMSHFWDKEKKSLNLDRADEIMAGCLITHDGDVVNETIRKAYG
jgi:H+-translocating NAD(P) transhydrogenase subunit alpha